MNMKLFPRVIAVCLGLILSLNAFAQEQMKGQLIAIHQDIVLPSKVAEYEKAAKNLASLFAEHNMTTMPYTAANTEDFAYLYIMPVENYGGLDNMKETFNSLKTKMGEEAFMAAMKQFDGTYESSKAYLVRSMPELSHNPQYGSEISQGLNFRKWDFYYVQGGKEQQAMAIAKEWKDLYTKHNIAEGYRVYMGDWGSDMPVIIVAQPALNAPEFYAASQRHMDTLGDEAKELMQRTMAIVRRFETKNGAIRPDLSYLPAPVATADEQ